MPANWGLYCLTWRRTAVNFYVRPFCLWSFMPTFFNCTVNGLMVLLKDIPWIVWFLHCCVCHNLNLTFPFSYMYGSLCLIPPADYPNSKEHARSSRGESNDVIFTLLTLNGGYVNWLCRAARSHIPLLRRPIGERESLSHAASVVGSSSPTFRKS